MQHITTYANSFCKDLHKQVDTLITTKFSPYLCGYKENLNAPFCS